MLAYQFRSGQLTVGHQRRPAARSRPTASPAASASPPAPAALSTTCANARRCSPRSTTPPRWWSGFVAPAPRSVLAAKYGKSPEEASPFVAGLMRAIGFDRIFDFSFAADLTIMEETTEFLNRVASGGVMPQFTSCCPGWVNLVEKRYPELIPHLSSCKSPQQMMGATVKTHFAQTLRRSPWTTCTWSRSCRAWPRSTRPPGPSSPPSGIRDVDAVLTTTEFMEMVDMVRLESGRGRAGHLRRAVLAGHRRRGASSAPPAGSLRPPCGWRWRS